MPAGLMLILVVYLVRDVPHQAPTAALVTVGPALLVAVLHLWRSSALLSIFAGTAVYVLATNVLVPQARSTPAATCSPWSTDAGRGVR